MFTHKYRGCFIHGYFDKSICKVSAFGIPASKEFKSYRAAQLAIANAIRVHDAAMLQLARRDSLARDYLELIGYDPFIDDPNISPDLVSETLAQYRAERESRA